MNIISFDTEYTNTPKHNELLELSIIDVDGNEIFHHYFKPEYVSKWNRSQDIHGITPEQVKDESPFSEYINEVQAIIDDADYIVGFELESDIKMLESSGIEPIETSKMLEMREWYWLINTSEEKEYSNVPCLITCAEELGFDWNANGRAHCATTDAIATMYCYNTLLGKFKEANPDISDVDAINKIAEDFLSAKNRIDEVNAKGFIVLVQTSPQIYTINVKSANCENPSKKNAKVITVNDRHKAEYEIREKFSRKQVNPFSSQYKLTDKDISWFLQYTNTFNNDSDFYKKLLKLKYRH